LKGKINFMSSGEKEILTNRAAFHEYHILDKYEAGAVLQGTEVKSVMSGRIQLKESYVGVKDNEVWLFNAHISPYSHGNINNHEPLRTRKLLLKKREIDKLIKETSQKGMTLVVTRIYWKNGRIKFEIGVAKGKKLYDKRETEMKRTIERETRSQLKEASR
jgi:SsrA-binding protein